MKFFIFLCCLSAMLLLPACLEPFSLGSPDDCESQDVIWVTDMDDDTWITDTPIHSDGEMIWSMRNVSKQLGNGIDSSWKELMRVHTKTGNIEAVQKFAVNGIYGPFHLTDKYFVYTQHPEDRLILADPMTLEPLESFDFSAASIAGNWAYGAGPTGNTYLDLTTGSYKPAHTLFEKGVHVLAGQQDQVQIWQVEFRADSQYLVREDFVNGTEKVISLQADKYELIVSQLALFDDILLARMAFIENGEAVRFIWRAYGALSLEIKWEIDFEDLPFAMYYTNFYVEGVDDHLLIADSEILLSLHAETGVIQWNWASLPDISRILTKGSEVFVGNSRIDLEDGKRICRLSEYYLQYDPLEPIVYLGGHLRAIRID